LPYNIWGTGLRRLYIKVVPSAKQTLVSSSKSSKKKAVIAKAPVKKEAKPKFTVTIGPPKLTRFEKARMIGARALQLALGAPPFIPLPPDITNPISLALREIEANALPISIRRSLPNGEHQDIPLEQLLSSF
jgi:DNA-directed RNA polymerase I, II, and III subunit RPABC2